MKQFITGIIMFVCLISCSAPVKQGAEFDDRQVENIIKGETSKHQLVQWFGEPSIKSTVSENEEKWVYSFTRGKVTSAIFTTKSDITTKILDIYLRDDVVENYAFSERKEEI